MPAIRTFARPSRTMHTAAAARIRVRASAAASSRWLRGRPGALLVIGCPFAEPISDVLTVQSVSDGMLVTMRRQGSQQASAPRVETALDRPLRPSLEALFDPSSIAVVGASDDSAKWGHILARRALESSGGRPVVLVNRAAREVMGLPAHPTLVAARAVGAEVDLVLV